MALAEQPTPVGGPYFAQAVDWVIDVAEGGSKLVTDYGGLTKYGISQKGNPDIDVENLTREQAEDIYLQRYWMPLKPNLLPPTVVFVLFDAAVNMGVRTSVLLLQGVLKIKTDGVVGLETVEAINKFHPVRELVARLVGARLRWYEGLVRSYPKYTNSHFGWTMRCVRLAMEAGGWRL